MSDNNSVGCIEKELGRGCNLIDEDSGECPHEPDACPLRQKKKEDV